jgi:DNA-binding MarR family transcriptional regulator
VQRLHAAEDRRKVMVQITRKGIELVKRLRNVIAKSITSAMADGSDDSDSGQREAVRTQLREFVVGA